MIVVVYFDIDFCGLVILIFNCLDVYNVFDD